VSLSARLAAAASSKIMLAEQLPQPFSVCVFGRAGERKRVRKQKGGKDDIY